MSVARLKGQQLFAAPCCSSVVCQSSSECGSIDGYHPADSASYSCQTCQCDLEARKFNPKLRGHHKHKQCNKPQCTQCSAVACACKLCASRAGVVLAGQQRRRAILLAVDRIYDLPVASEAAAEHVCVMQPFSTLLFAQSNPAGPERLVRKLSGQITEDEIMMSERKNKRMLRT